MSSRIHPSLTELIEKVLARDEQAQQDFRQLYDRELYRHAVDLLLERGCGSPVEDGRDVTNQVWNKIFRGLHALWSASNLKGWMHSILENEVHGHLRKCLKIRKHEIPFSSLTRTSGDSDGEELAYDPPSLVGGRESMENAILLKEMLAAAWERSERFYVMLRLVGQGLSLREVSLRLGESEAKTHTYFYRELRKLGQSIKEKEEEANVRSAQKSKDGLNVVSKRREGPPRTP